MDFKRRLRYFMTERHMTKAELARKSGLSDSLISGLLKSDEPNPSKETMEKLAAALEISPAMFFIDEDNYVVSVRDFLLPHLSPELQEFVSRRDSGDFIVLAKELKASDLSPEILRKLIDSYLKMCKPIR